MLPMRQTAPRVTDADIAEAGRHNWEAVGIAARNRGQLLYLKFLTDTGHSATVCLSPAHADCLRGVLKTYLPERVPSGDPPATWRAEIGEDFATFQGDGTAQTNS